MQTIQSRESLSHPEIEVTMFEGTRPAVEELSVLKIQRTCVHDGPGIRTTIFFQGCNLRCRWCQNPESQAYATTMGSGAHSIDDIMAVVTRDRDYYGPTSGGVTLSGGEPLMQRPGPLVALLKRLKREGIHVAVETTLHAPWKTIAAVAPYVDLFYVDLKIVGDEALHRQYTGQESALIHDNCRTLMGLDASIRFRMVMVPGFTDGEEHIAATAAYLQSLGHEEIELLKYHNMYEEKARRLGLAQEPLSIGSEESTASMRRALDLFRARGIAARCLDLESSRQQARFTQRVYDIQKDIRESDYHLCIEVSKLKTRYYRKNGFRKPTPIHRAERLDYVLRNKTIRVYPGELLVGNFTAHRVGGQVWEEHYGVLFASILYQIDRQTPVSFQCSFRDKLTYYFNILPFWLRRGLMGRVNRKLRDLVLTVARSSEMNVGFNNNMAAIAHFIVNFERMLALGTTGIRKEIEEQLRTMPAESHDFYRGALIALDALDAFALRYSGILLDEAKGAVSPARRRELEEMAEICSHVPKHPARTFHEALQSMTLLQVALCIESYENAVSLGRLDQILYPYYLRDKAAGILTDERAKELLALFILKMDEAILVNDGDTYLRIGRLFETQSTDQTVTVGGVDRDGRDATNELTYMLLDVCELQPLAVNMTARIHEGSPEAYKERIAEVYINGAPMPALYNDAVYIDTLQRHYPTPVEEARNYAIVGCVEPNASDDHFGNTDCANMNLALPFLQALKGEEHDLWNFDWADRIEKMLTKFHEYHFSGKGAVSRFVLGSYMRVRNRYKRMRGLKAYNPPATMDELLARFQTRLNTLAQSILADHQKIEGVLREHFTTPLASSLFKGCVERGKDAYEGGTTFNSSGIQGVGITDVGDSLHALDEVVFKQRRYRLDEVLEAIDRNFEGEKGGQIREALLAVPKFGNDASTEAQAWVNRTMAIYVNALKSVPNCPRGGIYTAGYYALNVNIIYGLKTPALPSGRLAGVPLANSVTPHYGMEQADLLSSLNSVAGIDYSAYAPNGATVTFTIDAALFQGRDGVKNLAGIVDTFFKKGGMQFQPNVINREILLEAYHHPEKHPYLLVRVAGYCSYFNDLSDELKRVIINRTCYM